MSANPVASVNPRQRTHRWTRENRIVLSLLCQHYDYTTQKHRILAIWNEVFRNDLLEEGLINGKLTLSTIESQKGTMSRPYGTGCDVWNEVSRLSLGKATRMFSSQNALIKAAERKLIDQQLEAVTITSADENEWSDSPSESSSNPVGDRRQPNEHSGGQTEEERLSQTRYQESVNGSNLGQILRRPVSRPLLRTQRLFGQRTIKCPTLLFRGYVSRHGLRARRFVRASATIPAPPPFNTKSFAKQVLPHLEGKISYDSPFMSLAENPKNSLKWAQQGRDFAVLLLEDIVQDAENRYGDVGSPYPYLAHNVIHHHELLGLPRGYEGSGEVRMEFGAEGPS